MKGGLILRAFFFATVIATTGCLAAIAAAEEIQEVRICMFTTINLNGFMGLCVMMIVLFPSIIVLIKTACDCDYHLGGCRISWPAVEGQKCRCQYIGFWMCTGHNVLCGEGEHCPANCYSKTCCLAGGGDCGGY
jgi:hypothetical protein